ncbi:MAG: hypothetical protein HZB98_02680, partial [Bacteroidia bacterium]|nr:hypothetical protein [Bacteroidia bacterium]
LRKKKIQNLQDIEIREKVRQTQQTTETSSNKQRYLEKKEYERNLRKLKKRLEESETLIAKIEAEILAVDKSFMAPGNSSEAHDIAYHRYRELKDQLNEEMNKWTQYSQELEDYIKEKGE